MSVIDKQDEMLRRAGGVWFDFEQLIVDIYKEVSRPGDCIFDVGANRGDHTFQMAQQVAPNGRVFAIEAVPEIAKNLESQRSGHFRGLAPVVQILNVGAYDRAEKAKFYAVPDQTGLGSLRDRPNVDDDKVEIEVDLARLDDVIEPVRMPLSFMKFDVEGAELFAMRGAINHIERHLPVIVFEFDKISAAAFSYTADDMLNFLGGLGYEVFDFMGGEMRSRAEFEAARVWNFIAFHGNIGMRRRVFHRLETFMERLLVCN